MAENPPLNRLYVAGYSANDRDYPIVSMNLDPRVAGYKVPEDLSTCPDKRYPNHVFTGAQPISGDERVRHVWEILPSPWVPFTRYDDDLGPVQGRRRSVKNEGQVASLTTDKRTTYEAREGSAIVYTELEETWSIKVDEDGNSLFPIRDRDFYDASRGPIQERRQLFVPTGEEEGSLENVNGVITQTSYEPYNEFLSVKIVQTYRVNGPQLIGRATDNDGQLVTVTTQRKGADGYIPPNPTATRTVEVSREDAESLVERIIDTPEVFKANTFSVERPDPIPQKFRVAVPIQSSQEIVEGTAVTPTLEEGEISKTEEQRNKFIKRVSSTSRDQAVLPQTLTGKTTNNERQEVTVTETLQEGNTTETPTATTTIESEALGDGNYVITKTEIPEVFEAKRVQATRENLIPPKFKIFSPEVSEEKIIEGQVSNVFLEGTSLSKSEQQINKFVKRIVNVSKQSPVGVSKINITNGGSGYGSEPTVEIVPINGGSGAEARAIINGGVVEKIEIISRGYGYDNGATVLISGGNPSAVATAVVEVAAPSISEKFLTQSGYVADRFLSLVKKEENKDYIDQNNPLLVDANLEQIQEDEFILTQSFTKSIESLPSFRTSSPEIIPTKFRVETTDRTITSETSGKARQPVIDVSNGLLESSEQQISYNVKRSTGRIVGKHSGSILSVTIESGGSDYSDQTNIEITGINNKGGGALVRPTISNGVVTSIELISGGYGYFDGVQYTATDYNGSGSGLVLSFAIDEPLENNDDSISLKQKITTQEKQLAEVTEILRNSDIGDLKDVNGNLVLESPDALTELRSENLGGGKYLVTKTVVPEVFPSKTIQITKEDTTPLKFRAAQKEETIEETVALEVDAEGNVLASEYEEPTLQNDEFSKTERFITKYTKRTSVVKRNSEENNELSEKFLTNQGQIATRKITLLSGNQEVESSAKIIRSETEALGDGRTVKTQEEVAEVFNEKQKTIRQDVQVPEKFLQGKQERESFIEEGTAAEPEELGTGGSGIVESTAQRVTEHKIQKSKVFQEIVTSLVENQINNAKQKVTVTSTIVDNPEVTASAITEFVRTQAIGGGKFVKEEGTVDKVFENKSFSKQIPDPAPQKFRIELPTLVEEITEEATDVSGTDVELGNNEIEKSVQQVDSFTKRTRTTSRQNAQSATLIGKQTGQWGEETVTETYDENGTISVGYKILSNRKTPLGRGKFLGEKVEVASPIELTETKKDAETGVVFTTTKKLVPAGSSLPSTNENQISEITPIDAYNSIQIITSVNSIPSPETFESSIDVSYPDVLEEVGIDWDASTGGGAGSSGGLNIAQITQNDYQWTAQANANATARIIGAVYTKIRRGHRGSVRAQVTRTYYLQPPTDVPTVTLFAPVYGTVTIKGRGVSINNKTAVGGFGAAVTGSSSGFSQEINNFANSVQFGPFCHTNPPLVNATPPSGVSATFTASGGSVPAGLYPTTSAIATATASAQLQISQSSPDGSSLNSGYQHVAAVRVEKWRFGIWIQEVYTAFHP